MKTLLTGAGGLVGSTLQADIRVVGRKREPAGPDLHWGEEEVRKWCDLTNFEATLNLFEQERPTHIIHCAGRVGGLSANLNHMGEFFYDNMLINMNVLEAARRTGVIKVLSFMSTCIFPDNVTYPLTEDMLHQGEPHTSNYGYAYSKRMLDIQSKAYNEQYGTTMVDGKFSFGTKYVTVIPTNIYGPNDNFELENSHVVPALIHKCYVAKRDNTPFVIWGSGKPLREFIFSEDVGKITRSLLDTYSDTNPIIISTGVEHSIRDVVIAIADAMDFQGAIIYDDNKPDGQYKKTTDNSRLIKQLPGLEFTPLQEGIQKTVDWFVDNYENCRR